MSASKHLGLRDAVAALFLASTPLAGGRVLENRNAPLLDGIASQIHVTRVQSLPEKILIGALAPVDWTTEVRVLIKARRSGTTSAEVVADDIACDCFARLFADQTLGGRCDLMDPGPFVWDEAEEDSNVVVVAMTVTLTHRTEGNVIT